jgi:hypothetical protein
MHNALSRKAMQPNMRADGFPASSQKAEQNSKLLDRQGNVEY